MTTTESDKLIAKCSQPSISCSSKKKDNEQSVFNPMNHITIEKNAKNQNKHRKIMNSISYIYKQNKSYSSTINSLQEQNKALLSQKQWYKNKLRKLESIINQVFANQNDYKNIQFDAPFKEITNVFQIPDINIQSSDCIDSISKNDNITKTICIDSHTTNGNKITNNSDAMYTTHSNSNTKSNKNDWFCFDMNSINVTTDNITVKEMDIKFDIMTDTIHKNDFNEFDNEESDGDIEILSKCNDKLDDIDNNSDMEVLESESESESEERTYNCKECERTFMKESYLMQHIRLTHDKLNYPCPICKIRFNKLEHCKLHVTEKHSMSLRGWL